ncbi:hypothetical protein JVT61DRAFT_7096 [Boletus reticuloceps]|uniref:Uncharacterized protein n=1 Tax=Boletus reticuloceps TaxID=495285 RepID=A0A8I2YIQ4_9AGAM|nr:hypothetical protein JVT61DRAFT_7096 [Boletus reticuloceps]
MSNQSDPPNLRLHISDLQDILNSIALNNTAKSESVWYEYWDCVLNYWTRRVSDRTMRLSVAPQRQLVREILSDNTQADTDQDWSFEANRGDTSMDLSGNPPSIQKRIREARAGVETQYRIPDFTAFALRRHGLPHRRLVCIIEIKPRADMFRSRVSRSAPQIVTQAKFAFDSFPDLRHVLAIIAFGDSWCMYRFPRDEVTRLYHEQVEGLGDKDAYDPERESTSPTDIDIDKFIVILASKVLKADGSNYHTAFEKALSLITTDLKASSDPLKHE